MMRGNRVKTFNTGSLVSDAAGDIQEYPVGGHEPPLYSPGIINGLLWAIQVKHNEFAATGSMILTVSGTGEVVWTLTSGTETGTVAGSDTYFPRAFTRFSEKNTLLSGTTAHTEMDLIPINSDLLLDCAGLGKAKYGSGLCIIYI